MFEEVLSIKRNAFKSLDDFRNSPLWSRIQESKGIPNTRVLKSTRLENMIYNDLRQDDPQLNVIESLGAEKLDTFPSLIHDTFQSMYSLNPRRNAPDTLTTNARRFNAEILDYVTTNDEYPTLKSLCEGRELPAYEAVSEFSERIFEKLDELLETAGGDKNTLNVLNKLERQQKELKEKIQKNLERLGDGVPAEQEEKHLLDLAAKVESKERQIERLSEMISQNIRKNKDFVQSAVISALISAKDKAQETSDILSSWGNDAANPEALEQNKELLRRVHGSSKLKDIAKYLGKYREILNNTRKNSFTYGRGDKYDIALGNDFNRAVSSEYAYLALPETVPLFIQKVQRKVLKQYRKREHVSKGYGDIVVCVDESSSMKGDAIAWAKAVALVFMEYAIQNGRSCGIIRFSSKGSTQEHIFQKGKYNTDNIFAFAESFLGGGTNFEEPLTKGIDLMEHNGFQNADIVFLTDGECAISEEFAALFRNKSKQLNFTVTGIIIDSDTPGMTFSLTPFCDKVYRLSEMSCNDIAESIIIKVG